MTKKNRTVLATDEDWNLIQAYAAARGRSASNYVIETALSEISRHAAKPAFKDMVRELVLEVLKDSFPSRGALPGDNYKRIGEEHVTPRSA